MIPPPYCIRDAEPADARALAQIRVASWRMAYAGIVPGAILERMDLENGHFAERLASDEVKQAIAGFFAKRRA